MSDPLLSSIAHLPGAGQAPPAHGPAPAPAVRESPLDPKYFLHVLLKRLWLVLAIVLVVPTAAWLYVRKLPKEYQATASMVLDTTTPQYMGPQYRDVVDFDHGSWWSAFEYMETQFRIIRSRWIASLVAQDLCKQQVHDPATGADVPAMRLIFPGADCTESGHLDALVPTLQQMIVVQGASRNNRVVEIVAITRSPQGAAILANAYANTFINSNLEQRVSASGDAADWLGSQFSQMQARLITAEAKLIKFKTDNGLLNIDEQQSDLARKQRRIADELQAVDLKLIALRPLHERLSRYYQPGPLKDDDTDPVDEIPPALGENDTINTLKDEYLKAQRERIELAEKYLEKHPRLTAQDARVHTLRQRLRQEIRLSIEAGLQQYDMLVQQEQDLKKAAAEATREALGLQGRVIQYNQLKLDYDRLRKTAEAVGGRETDTMLASRLRTNNVRLLDPATAPHTPVAPNVQRAVITAMLVALLLAFALAFVLEISDTTIKTQEDMEQVLHVPFLGMIPHLPEEPGDGSAEPQGPKDLFVARHPKSTVSECCRVIRTNLLFMSTEKPVHTLLVTSAAPQEGKSISSVSLALSMAQSGTRVLLVDTDLRRPRLHKVFGLPSGGVGLTTAIAGTVPVLEAVRPTDEANLFLLTCGPMPPNPAELLQTERFRQIVREVGAAFDKVIFDSPPIGAVTDGLVLSQVVDGVVLVAKSHKTSRDMLRRAYRQLRDLQANMLGCVLNDLDLESRRKGYGYPYYYYYKSGYYRYGYSSEEGEAAEGSAHAHADVQEDEDVHEETAG